MAKKLRLKRSEEAGLRKGIGFYSSKVKEGAKAREELDYLNKVMGPHTEEEKAGIRKGKGFYSSKVEEGKKAFKELKEHKKALKKLKLKRKK